MPPSSGFQIDIVDKRDSIYISDINGDIIEEFGTGLPEIMARIDTTWKRFCVSALVLN